MLAGFDGLVRNLYGYKESPRLWADDRDQEIHKMKVDMRDGSALALQQMVTEPNMWRIVKYTPGPFDATQAEQFCGILIIYVDDLLLLGEPAVLDSLVDTIQSKWEISSPEEIDSVTGVRFLGTELFVKEEGVVGHSEELPAGLAQPQFGSTALDETKGANVG